MTQEPIQGRYLPWRGWKLAVRGTAMQFTRNQLLQLAAALSFFNILGLLPGLMAIVSILGFFGQSEQTIDTLLRAIEEITGFGLLTTMRQPLMDISQTGAPLPILIISLLGALWTVSAYVDGFGQALNSIYGVPEGRPVWKVRPQMMVVASAVLVIMILCLLLFFIGSDIAERIGATVGLSQVAQTVWLIGRWPVLLCLLVLLITLLFSATPNIRRNRRLLSVGAVFAILCWGALSFGFAVAVSLFLGTNPVYGSLGGLLVALVWIWLSNLTLLIGAAFDAEFLRSSQLASGLNAAQDLQLPLRDDRALLLRTRAHSAYSLRAERLREDAPLGPGDE